jgi:N-acetylglutamate synthase
MRGGTTRVCDVAAVLGRRVVVRRVVAVRDGRPRYSDVLGYLVAANPDELVVSRADGTRVTVPRAEVHRLREVPPPPVRAGRADVLALQEVAALGWPAPDTERLGGWLLRAGGGFTGRANSVLPAGDPGLPLDAALRHVEAWYAARRLPALVQVPLPACADLDAALAERGYGQAVSAAHVLVAEVAGVLAAAGGGGDPGPRVRVDPEPSGDWLALYHYRRARTLPAVARGIMTAPEHVAFATAEDGGEPVAIGRAVVTGDWAGLTALEVREDRRRRGYARAVLAALAEWALGLGARRVYLQVAVDNAPALALYARLAFTCHHTYHYRRHT